MKYFNFRDYVHHIFVRNEFLILDEISDRYYLLDENDSAELILVLSNDWSGYQNINLKSDAIKKWINRGLIKEVPNEPKINFISQEAVGLGSYSAEIEIPSTAFRPSTLRCLKYVLALCIASLAVKFFSLHHILNFCRKIKLNAICIDDDLDKMQEIINQTKLAALYCPLKAKCLERSVVAYLIARSKKISCTLCIGAQRYDFLSHCWIELDGNPIGERSSLKSMLPTLLKI